jgi:hypothetical protein
MHDIHRFLPLLTALLLCACSADKAPEPEPAPPSKTVFDPLTQTMDRARGVQGTVDAQSQATRQGIEQAEGGAPAGDSSGSAAPR